MERADDDKAANLIIGDAINNLRTVQSFGYEHVIIEKYEDYLKKGYKTSVAKHIKAALAFGFS